MYVEFPCAVRALDGGDGCRFGLVYALEVVFSLGFSFEVARNGVDEAFEDRALQRAVVGYQKPYRYWEGHHPLPYGHSGKDVVD